MLERWGWGGGGGGRDAERSCPPLHSVTRSDPGVLVPVAGVFCCVPPLLGLSGHCGTSAMAFSTRRYQGWMWV